MSGGRQVRDLYEAAYRRLVIELTTLTGDVEEAQDCVAEAFVRALERWRRVSTYDDPEGWVRHVAANLARSRWRRRRRRPRVELRDTNVPPLSEDHVALVEALRRLPAEQREALVLHYLADMPLEAVAGRQHVPVGTVKSRLSRGRRALAGELTLSEKEVDVP